MTTFIVDPGGYVLCVGRLSSGADSSPVRALKLSGFWTSFGSKPGIEAIARTAPVAGSIATSAARCPGR